MVRVAVGLPVMVREPELVKGPAKVEELPFSTVRAPLMVVREESLAKVVFEPLRTIAAEEPMVVMAGAVVSLKTELAPTIMVPAVRVPAVSWEKVPGMVRFEPLVA